MSVVADMAKNISIVETDRVGTILVISFIIISNCQQNQIPKLTIPNSESIPTTRFKLHLRIWGWYSCLHITPFILVSDKPTCLK